MSRPTQGPILHAHVRLKGAPSATGDMLERLLGALLADEVGRPNSRLQDYAVVILNDDAPPARRTTP
jgi:hypothetical protein